MPTSYLLPYPSPFPSPQFLLVPHLFKEHSLLPQNTSEITALKTATEIIISSSSVPQFSQLFSFVRQLVRIPKRPIPGARGAINTGVQFCEVAKAESPSRSTGVALDTLLKPSAPEGRWRPQHLPQPEGDCSTGPVLTLLLRTFPRLRSDEAGV